MNKDINLELENNEISIELDHSVVKVFPEMEDLTVTPTKEEQHFKSDKYGYGNITVEKIPDEYIKPNGTKDINSNGLHNVNEYENVNVTVAPNLQEKDITINENGTHTIIADEEYDGLNQVNVTVDAIEDLTEELNTYNEELIEQETTIDDIVGALKNKVASGGGGKYTPRYLNTISFQGYTGTELDYEIDNLDTTNLVGMSSLFRNCTNILKLILSKFNTSNVANMSGLCYGCTNLIEIDVSSFDTSNVTNMSMMFQNDAKLTNLNLSNFVTSNVTNTMNMFNGCKNLMTLDIRNFDFTNVTSYNNMFAYIPNDCEIIVKDETAKEWVLARRSDLTNVKTVAEL